MRRISVSTGNSRCRSVPLPRNWFLLQSPREHRATGMSVMYSLGVTMFGGFSPLIVTWLIGATGSPMAPAWYLLAAGVISLLALVFFPTYPGRD